MTRTVTGRWVRRGLVHRFVPDPRWRRYAALRAERYAPPAWWATPAPVAPHDTPEVCQQRLETLREAAECLP